jgi:hypothetical protein
MVACHSGESPVVGMALKIWTQFASFSKLPHPHERLADVQQWRLLASAEKVEVLKPGNRSAWWNLCDIRTTTLAEPNADGSVKVHEVAGFHIRREAWPIPALPQGTEGLSDQNNSPSRKRALCP